MISERDYPRKDGQVELNFDAETDQGTINFKGVLTQDEVGFLIRFALLTLIARGALPMMPEIEPNKMN